MSKVKRDPMAESTSDKWRLMEHSGLEQYAFERMTMPLMLMLLYTRKQYSKVFTEVCKLDDGAVEGEVELICWKIDFDR